MAEPYTSSISNSYLEKINNWLNQQKAGGRKVEPWQYEAALKAGLATEADRASQNYARNQAIALDKEKFASDVDYRNRTLESGDKASLVGAAEKALELYMLSGRGTPGSTPGIGDKLSTSAGKIYDKAAEGAGKLWDKVTGNPVAEGVGQGTAQSPVTPALAGSSGISPSDPGGVGGGSDAGTGRGGDTGTSSGSSPWDYALPVAGGFAGEALSRKTGLGEWTSNKAPVGGRQDWDRAAGAGVSAGLASLAGANPWVAALSYLGLSIGKKKLFG